MHITTLPWRTRLVRLAGAAVLAATVIGCDDPPTTPTDTPQTVSIGFGQRLQAGAFAWRTFTLTEQSKVEVQLISILPDTTAVVALALGTFVDGDCAPTTTIETAPATTPQITTDLAAGSYCVRVADIGNLTRDWQFTIFIDITN